MSGAAVLISMAHARRFCTAIVTLGRLWARSVAISSSDEATMPASEVTPPRSSQFKPADTSLLQGLCSFPHTRQDSSALSQGAHAHRSETSAGHPSCLAGRCSRQRQIKSSMRDRSRPGCDATLKRSSAGLTQTVALLWSVPCVPPCAASVAVLMISWAQRRQSKGVGHRGRGSAATGTNH